MLSKSCRSFNNRNISTMNHYNSTNSELSTNATVGGSDGQLQMLIGINGGYQQEQQQQQQPQYSEAMNQMANSNNLTCASNLLDDGFSNTAMANSTTQSNEAFIYQYSEISDQSLNPYLSQISYSNDNQMVQNQPIQSADLWNANYQLGHQNSVLIGDNVAVSSAAITMPVEMFSGTNAITTTIMDHQYNPNMVVKGNHQPLQHTSSTSIAIVATVPITPIVAQQQSGKKQTKRQQKVATTTSGGSGMKNETTGRVSKPVSAYALFFRDTQASIKAANPNATFGEISKIVASKWDMLNKQDKDVYKDRADQEKRNYLQNLASSKAKQVAAEIGTIQQIQPQQLVESNSNYLPSMEFKLNSDGQPPPPPITSTAIIHQYQPQQIQSSELILQPNSILEMNNGLLGDNSYHHGGGGEIHFEPNTFQSNHHSTINPVLSQNSFTDQFTSTSSGEVALADPLLDENSFFDPATNNLIDLGLDLNDFDESMMLLNSSDILCPNDYLNDIDDVVPTVVVTSASGFVPTTTTTNHFYTESKLDQTDTGNPSVETQNGPKCIRAGCDSQVAQSTQWDSEFCSEECCVKHCAEMFSHWTNRKSSEPAKPSGHLKSESLTVPPVVSPLL